MVPGLPGPLDGHRRRFPATPPAHTTHSAYDDEISIDDGGDLKSGHPARRPRRSPGRVVRRSVSEHREDLVGM